MRQRLIEVITFHWIYNDKQASRYRKFLRKDRSWNKSALKRLNLEGLERVKKRLDEDPEYQSDTKEKASKYE